ncbi:MAG TPA: hypothetical protein VFQ61_11485 [Polyangiaceae bacterium]|nr:hypothetical protein [Polyangiaceae bacterium]
MPSLAWRMRGRSSLGVALVSAQVFWSGAPLCAEPGGIEIDVSEIYLDTTTGVLSGRMRQGFDDKDINRVALIAPENSHVTLSYWPARNCPGGDRPSAPPPPGAEQRSGAPTGAVVVKNDVRVQKFVTRVGPLTVGQHYCLHYEIQSMKGLSDADRQRVDAALSATISILGEMALGSRANLQRHFAEKLAGSPAREDESFSCTELLATRRLNLEPREFATLFHCELGWPLNRWVVADPVDGRWTTIRSSIERYINHDKALKRSLSAAWQSRVNAWSARDEIIESLESGLFNQQTRLPDRDLVYDPLFGVELSALRAALRDPELKRQFQNPKLDTSYAEFAHEVWVQRARLLGPNPKSRNALSPPPVESRLNAFCSSPIEPRIVVVRRAELEAAKASFWSALEQGVPAAQSHIPKLPAASELQKYPPNESDRELIIQLSQNLYAIDTAFERYKRNAERARTELLLSAGYLDFRNHIRELVDSSGAVGFALKTRFAERFPFWVTGDLGVATAFFASEPKTDPRLGMSLYFGLNFYLTELDKSEPLHITDWRGRDWARRFAIAAGITLTDPSSMEDYGLDGVIGARMLMFGGGLRLTDYVRLNGGGLLYTQRDPNPLSDSARLKVAPYMSASLDVDVIGTVSGWFGKARSSAP